MTAKSLTGPILAGICIFLTLTGFRNLSGLNAVCNIHYQSRCLSSPVKSWKSAIMWLGVSKAEGGLQLDC